MDKKIHSKKKIGVTEQNMRNFRTKMLNSKNKKFQFLRNSVDFFCLSNFRDLIFNYNEHTYDLIQIKKLLERKNLNFLTFNEMNPNLIKLFKTHFPYADKEFILETWDKFEKIYPKTFFGMYKFWVEKKNKFK